MPPLLLIAGIPQKVYQRAKRFEFEVEDWDVQILPSSNKDRPEWTGPFAERVLSLIFDSTGGGHVLGFGEEGKKEPWTSRLRQHVRFRWLNNKSLYLLTSDPNGFESLLRTEAEFERAWRQEILPRDERSPLLLPECTFSPAGYFQMWSKAAAIAPSAHPSGPQFGLKQVTQQVAGFRDMHRMRDNWLDARELIFSNDELHAIAPEQWKWKLSFRVSDGFHYNVNHLKGRSFTVCDLKGTVFRQKSGEHINVDCHGWCRK